MSEADKKPDHEDAPAPQEPNSAGLQPTGIYSPLDSASELVRVLDQFLADLQAGRAPDKAALLADHPELAAQLENCLAGIEFVHRAAKPQSGTPSQLGDFRIVREVGRGGMGVVYEAEQLSLKRKVALKVLRFGVTADQEVMQRFQREAETVAHLHHTNIVPIHAVGCEQGVHYYAMQFIEGQSLATVAAEAHAGDVSQNIPPARFQQVAGWMLQAAEALAHAHQRGVIHRDIKPSNLILDPEGTVWLTDFGLAKRADEVTLTAAGVLMGTPRYMSPEQAAATRQPVDHRTDIYSLGATLYELATGKPVFDSQTPQGVLTQILNAEPVRPRLVQGQLPRDLETIILKCLAKEPARRYQTARELADDLRALLENRAIRARRMSLGERASRWVRKNRRSTAVSAISAAAALLVVAGAYSAAQKEALLPYAPWLQLLARMQIDTRFQGKFAASDIVQQTLLEACRDLPQFRGTTEAELLAWLRQILAHVLAHEIRRYRGTQQRDLDREVSLEDALAQTSQRLGDMLADPGPSPSARVSQREQEVLLADVLAKLPDDYREVIILRNLEGLSHEEVARRMGRGTGAVRMLWVRALAALRVALVGD